MLKFFYYFFLFLFLFAQFMPVVSVLAQGGSGSGTTAPNTPLTGQKIVEILCRVVKWMFWVLIALSVIMVIYAAYLYVTSGGNAESVSKANKTILYAAAGVAVAIFARGMPPIVASFVGIGNIGTPCPN